MGLWHIPEANEPVSLAADVELATTAMQQSRGLMFRRRFPEGNALIFEFEDSNRRIVHTFFVRMPIDVLWIERHEVTKVERMRPWADLTWGRADRLVELPAGSGSSVQVGDTVGLSDAVPTGLDDLN